LDFEATGRFAVAFAAVVVLAFVFFFLLVEVVEVWEEAAQTPRAKAMHHATVKGIWMSRKSLV
jgi:hypothetical protein